MGMNDTPFRSQSSSPSWGLDRLSEEQTAKRFQIRRVGLFRQNTALLPLADSFSATAMAIKLIKAGPIAPGRFCHRLRDLGSLGWDTESDISNSRSLRQVG